jgi:hypothetical protein
MTDEEFMRHLHKQMEEQKRDQGLTTIRSLERKQRERQRSQNKPKTKPKNTD